MSGPSVAAACFRFRTVVAAGLCLASVIWPRPSLAATPVEAEVAAAVKAMEGEARDGLAETIAARIAEMHGTLDLSEERVAGLRALGEKAIEQSMGLWLKLAESTVQSTLSQQPDYFKRQENGMSITLSAENLPLMQPAWKEGLPKLVTLEEIKRVDDRRSAHKARRVRHVAKLFLLFVDQKLALTASQRAQLLPVAEKFLPKQEGLFPPDNEESDFLSPGELLAAGEHAPEKQIRAIIADAQWARWKKVCVPPTEEDLRIRGAMPGGNRFPGQPAASSEPEAAEKTISEFMAGHADRRRQQLAAPMLLQVEEVARVAGLSPAAQARLQTGARGAAEKSLQAWTQQFERTVRSHLGDIDSVSLPQQLANLANSSIEQAPSPVLPPAALWEKCLQTELTAEQRAAWQQEIDARVAFRTQVLVGTVLTGLDCIVPLNAEQDTRLSAMLTQLLVEYREALDIVLSSTEDSSWFLQPETRCLPLAGLKADEVCALLGKASWDRWVATEEFAEDRATWKVIEQNHEERRRERGRR